MFLKSVQTWASSGAGQGASAYLTKPVPASEYDKYSLKNPRNKTKAVIPRPPTKKGSSSFGSIDYGATPTMKKLDYVYDAKSLKRPGGIKTPIATPYTRKKAMEIFSKSHKAPDEKGPVEPKKPRLEQIKELIQSMNPDDPIRTQLIQMLNVIQRLNLISQKRPLTPHEETMIKEINFEIDKLIDEQEEQQNPEPIQQYQQQPPDGQNAEEEEEIREAIQTMELMTRADPNFQQLEFNQRQAYLEDQRDAIRQRIMRNNQYLRQRQEENPAGEQEVEDEEGEGKYDENDDDGGGYQTAEELPGEKTDDEQFERESEVSEYPEVSIFMPRRTDMYGNPADNYELFKIIPAPDVEDKIRFLNTGNQGPRELIYKINSIMSKYDMGFRNLWNRINQVSPGITPINKLSNKAVLALVIEFFENPRMSQGTKDAEVIYKDIINGIAVPEDPEERPIGEAKEAKEERLIEPKGGEDEVDRMIKRTLRKKIIVLDKDGDPQNMSLLGNRWRDTLLAMDLIDDYNDNTKFNVRKKRGDKGRMVAAETRAEWIKRVYTSKGSTPQEQQKLNQLRDEVMDIALQESR